MEKYGFVYIWYDRSKKRFYIGCHWGFEGDGYICSSSNMKKAYKRRPEDFGKPRILARVYTNKHDLFEEEYKWLLMIKPEELGKKYYNLHNRHFTHWSISEKREVILKKNSERLKKQWANLEFRAIQSKAASDTLNKLWQDPKYIELFTKKASENRRNSEHFEGMKMKISEKAKKRWENSEYKADVSEKVSTRIKEMWQDPEYREKTIRKRNEAGRKISENGLKNLSLANLNKPKSCIKSSTGYKGVYRNREKYKTQICKGNKVYNLGTYDTPEKAAMVYNIKAIELYGELAVLNHINGLP